MLTMIGINFKRLRIYCLLLCLLVICQLAFGHLASQALGDTAPATKIAIQNDDAGIYGEKYIEGLSEIEGLELDISEGNIIFEDVFSDSSYMGAVIIPENFSKNCISGKANSLKFYAAPGVADNSLVQQYLMLELTVLRSEIILGDAQRELGIEDTSKTLNDDALQMISLEYIGPAGQMPFSDIPVFGISALLLLLVFLMASSFFPGLDDKRTRALSHMAYIKALFAGIIALVTIWFAANAVYLFAMDFAFDAAVPSAICAALFALVLYAICLGALFAACSIKRFAPAFFVLWFVLNMTLGGGLWDRGLYSVWLAPVLPVSQVLSCADGSAKGAVALLVCALLSLCASIGVSAAKRKR